jgi:hypothetical protein
MQRRREVWARIPSRLRRQAQQPFAQLAESAGEVLQSELDAVDRARHVADAGQGAQLAERHVEAMRGTDELGESMRQRFSLIVDLGGVERMPEDAQQWRSSAAAFAGAASYTVAMVRMGAIIDQCGPTANDHLARGADAPTSRPRAATIVSPSGNAHGLAISRQSCVDVVASTKP